MTKKTLRQFMGEVVKTDPNLDGETNFKRKHQIAIHDFDGAYDTILKAIDAVPQKGGKREADYDDDESREVYENIEAPASSLAVAHASFRDHPGHTATANPGRGFHGAAREEYGRRGADQEFAKMHARVKAITGADNEKVKHYLDSTHGRHLGDHHYSFDRHDDQTYPHYHTTTALIHKDFKKFNKTYEDNKMRQQIRFDNGEGLHLQREETELTEAIKMRPMTKGDHMAFAGAEHGPDHEKEPPHIGEFHSAPDMGHKEGGVVTVGYDGDADHHVPAHLHKPYSVQVHQNNEHSTTHMKTFASHAEALKHASSLPSVLSHRHLEKHGYKRIN